MNIFKRIYGDLNKGVFYTTLVLSVVLLVASFILPPTGVIDTSVLAGIGELFAFATLATVISSIEKGNNIKLSKGETSIEIEQNEEQDK